MIVWTLSYEKFGEYKLPMYIFAGDIEEYLKIAENPKLMQENPQLTRIKQHFERKNKKYSQEIELLQKKLDEAEQRLEELDRGAPESGNRHRMLQNVGHGIK